MTASTWDVDGAVSLYSEGRTLRQIAEAFGIAETTVRKHLIKRGSNCVGPVAVVAATSTAHRSDGCGTSMARRGFRSPRVWA